ncbi:MAG TPA: hypothetical protein PK860_01740 [Paludibacteraceae bacterium]|nr:hypothetical protein [Paludibacteraceae bacterium]
MPFTITLPSFGLSIVPRICNKVVLPAPLGPTIAITSPSFTDKSTPFNTSRLPKLLWIFFAIIILLFCKD